MQFSLVQLRKSNTNAHNKAVDTSQQSGSCCPSFLTFPYPRWSRPFISSRGQGQWSHIMGLGCKFVSRMQHMSRDWLNVRCFFRYFLFQLKTKDSFCPSQTRGSKRTHFKEVVRFSFFLLIKASKTCLKLHQNF